MTDDELSRAVAVRCGQTEGPFLSYATSMDACLTPGGPVEYLRARGMMLVAFGWPDARHTCQIWRTLDDWAEGNAKAGHFWGVSADTLPRALCEAFLAATEGE